ncbi:laminin subunit alpha-3-like [Silurus meridionalis]|uniref:laminin subunit alpha-3-like n=1 Tax=Silurus meridionalis TaxID=175797 RepID=UPI001EEB88AB|nr:laminin subunit alpha-3-like [Silurus meridionalis]
MAQRRAPLLFPALICALAAVRARASVSGVPGGLSLTPPYFNLAEGSGISATATCGEEDNGNPRTDLYCKLVGGPTLGLTSQTIQGQYCDLCNANNPEKAHPVNNAIDGTERWWQSPPLSRGLRYNEINVTLDLGQLFHVAYIIVKFANSPRPDLWVLERSVDHGKTFTAWQYFAHLKKDCIERFGKEPNVKTVWDDEQICTTEYSRLVPLENGEIFVSLVNGRPGSKNFTYSPALQEFTTATHIRLRFLRTNTLLGHLISKAQRDPTVTRRYYYSIKDISVGGRCVCHGHAHACGVRVPGRQNLLQCECQHNTCGESCDRCCPGYHQKAWRAATSDSVSECEPCQCHSHATDCYYDAEVERRRASLNIHGRYDGGGVCTNCQHNTAGVNCEVCAEGYYRPYGVPVESPTGCIHCRCDSRTTSGCEMGSGRCLCKPQYSGDHCDHCARGHHSFPQCTPYADHLIKTTTPPPTGNVVDCPVGFFGAPNCQLCLCNRVGTLPEICSESGRCLCRHEVTGQRCDRCRPGHHSFPYCYSCLCDGPGVADGSCDPAGQCRCQPNYTGLQCEQCTLGYHSYPACSPCHCSREGSLDGSCDPNTGQCVCNPGVTGHRCDSCLQPDQIFPDCFACLCDGPGVADGSCDPAGQCRCKPNYTGLQCEQCTLGYHSYPACSPCYCSREGSLDGPCDPNTGQCVCNPGVTGHRCDSCVQPDQIFPDCFDLDSSCNPAGSDDDTKDPLTDACFCLPYVEGAECERCKPLYWNLDPENPAGCIECICDDKGTLSGVGECHEESGECSCKPNVCSPACDTCDDGYFLLQKKNYFGCQGCQCDVGGATGRGCDQLSGQCQCRKHMRGRTCSEPEPNFYIPDLHHLKFEAENGITPNARPVRFGYDPNEFPQFSWRGYATLSRAQPEVMVYVIVTSPGPFTVIMRYMTAGLHTSVRGRVVLVADRAFPLTAASEVCVSVHANETHPPHFLMMLRYANHNGAHVSGRVTVTRTRSTPGSGDSKEVQFPPSRSPAFLIVPGDGFAQPFTLSAGKWIVCVHAEGILLDYLVLLPSAYYEAKILQQEITEPCTYQSRDGNCLLYKHVPLEGFPSALASQSLSSTQRHARVRQPTADHPDLVSVNGGELSLTLHVPESGSHVLVLEYANERDDMQNVYVYISGQARDRIRARANIYSCAYSFLCRSVVVDGQNRIAHFLLPPKAEILLQSPTHSVLLYRVYAIPSDGFSMELIQPMVYCVSHHGRFTEDSKHCIQSQFYTPPTAISLDTSAVTRPSRFSTPASGRCDGLLLKSPQTEVELAAQVSQTGRYMFVVHYCQPEHTSFPVEVLLHSGETWTGHINASFCPSVSGCRSVVIAQKRIALDVLQQTLSITLKIPNGKTLTLDSVLVIPEDNYSPDLLNPKTLDLSPDFINQCRADGFYIDPHRASEFCKSSARSLVVRYLDGALPCSCDKAGSTSPTCEPTGGQCSCRPHVIGRQCSRCATGFYGFPYCRPCECGRRLCDEVTGECICPPQTVRPTCDVCRRETFSYHPLLGCEGCDCSPTGVRKGDTGQCDVTTGQCTCKPRIGGRQCSRCVAGYYRFSDCVACSCNAGGVTEQICDPDTGFCLCKRNVEGPRCDVCRKGSFYFDPSNPKGCTECFCFGVTDQCHSSDKRRGKFVDMHSWRLVTPDQTEVASVLNLLSNTVVADVQELPTSVLQLHWVLPQSYLGDRVSSYGGFLTYQVKSFGLPREGMSLLDKQPDVILKGEKIVVVYQDPQSPLPDRVYQGRVQLVEGNFRHSGTNRPVSRAELMRVLARLDAVWIRALYFTHTQRLSVGEVGLEEASRVGTGAPASTVEVCSCPPEYTGDSCQRCSRGYYRDRSGRCASCACNGLSDDCDESTGRCLNCQGNTAGDHCERCKHGYYGDAAMGTCKICPCPLHLESNNFAVGCSEVHGRIRCQCKPGYAGEKCERCAPGYFGRPEEHGGRCQLCNCNGNSCSSTTGVCNYIQDPIEPPPAEECIECDSCAQTLLNDLERLDSDLGRLKAQLDSLNSSSEAHRRLKQLEKAISEAKNMVKTYTSDVEKLRPKVNELERDVRTLTTDINKLKQEAEKKLDEAQKAVKNSENTHQKAKDLNDQALDMLKKIQELLKQLNNMDGSSGGSLPSGEVDKMLKEAERLVQIMQERSFKPQRDAAEKELDEAKKLLDYIKNTCTKQLNQNQKAADKIRELLQNYEDKLKDLEKSLNEANETVQKANTQNTLNAKTLNDQLERIRNLEKEKNKVEDDISKAKQKLKSVEDLLKMLLDSKKEYEEMAAELDGAKTELTDRVNSISQTPALEGRVKKAEDHAALLNKLANELQQAIQNSSGRADVKDALAAIDAYKNITEAIKAAEEAAKKAKEAADKALSDVTRGDISNRAKDLKDSGTTLQKDAKKAEENLANLSDELKGQQKRLNDAQKKKRQLEGDLRDINKDLNNIRRDDITTIISIAKRTAQAVNASASDTMNKLKDINAEIDAIKALNISGSPDQANINRILSDVDTAVKNLSSSIPSLLDKFTQVEKLSSEIDPNNNISFNIMHIKELIEQARSAANRVPVPMKFTGLEHVELRLPRNLDDLQAYTSMSLLLQRPEPEIRGDGRRRRRQAPKDDGDLFVLYLGKKDATKDYLGMALRKNVLYFVYKLNGDVKEIKSMDITLSKPDRTFFDKVDMRRIYEDAQVNLTKLFTTNSPDREISNSEQGNALFNLLNLNTSEAVFYVGGYPSDFTPPPPLNYPRYKGCIEFNMFNERLISLYNFKALGPENVNLQLPCKRYIRPAEGEYLDGTGYIQLLLEKVPKVLSIIQTVETRAENGIILYIGNEKSYYLITLEKRHLVLSGRVGDQELETKRSSETVDVIWELRVFFDVINKVVLVRIKNKEVVKGPYVSENFDSYYIGGIPSDLRKRNNITAPPLRGYVKDLNAVGKTPTPLNKVGVGRNYSIVMMALRKAEFSAGSSLDSSPTGFSLDETTTVSFGFKSTGKNGVLLQNKQANNEIGVSMVNGHVTLKYQNRAWRSLKQYQDGQWHYVTVTNKNGGTDFQIDESDTGVDITQSPNFSFDSDKVTLGAGSFTGCISNVYLRRSDALYQPEDLSDYSSSGDVVLDKCKSERQPEDIWDDRKKNGKEEMKDDAVSGCSVPTPIPQSFHLTGASSSLSYIMPSRAFTHRAYISLDVRSRSSEGLLFYIPSEQEKYHLALYVSKGRIRLSVGRQREIFNREKYNDGKWHTVTLSLEKRRFRLVIDGLRAQDGVLNPGESSSIQLGTAVYLGSPPPHTHTDLKWKILPMHGVVGCVRNFRINGSALAAPAVNRGVGPCFEGQMVNAVYFSGQGAHVIIDESFLLSQKFELVFELRPSNHSGLLLHVGNSDNHLTVYMRKGEVVAQVNNGGGRFEVSVQPKQTLCDGLFHRIAVIQRNHVVEMHVDTEGRYTIGPSSFSPANHRFPVYVGGIPDRRRLPFIPVTESYVGCLQNMLFNTDVVVFEKLSAIFGPVNVRECPANLTAPSPH